MTCHQYKYLEFQNDKDIRKNPTTDDVPGMVQSHDYVVSLLFLFVMSTSTRVSLVFTEYQILK